jgi:GNAT superfamily N-acetyltransferase
VEEMTGKVREIRYEEVGKLLELYRFLHEEDPVLEENDLLQKLWDDIYNDSSLYYLVLDDNDEIVSSSTLAIIKNLTRGAKPYGLIENVVTHPQYRKKGYGTSIINKAIEIAKENNCYKVMLLTGSKKEETLGFYEKIGFKKGIKTGFIVNL